MLELVLGLIALWLIVALWPIVWRLAVGAVIVCAFFLLLLVVSGG